MKHRLLHKNYLIYIKKIAIGTSINLSCYAEKPKVDDHSRCFCITRQVTITSALGVTDQYRQTRFLIVGTRRVDIDMWWMGLERSQVMEWGCVDYLNGFARQSRGWVPAEAVQRFSFGQETSDLHDTITRDAELSTLSSTGFARTRLRTVPLRVVFSCSTDDATGCEGAEAAFAVGSSRWTHPNAR